MNAYKESFDFLEFSHFVRVEVVDVKRMPYDEEQASSLRYSGQAVKEKTEGKATGKQT